MTLFEISAQYEAGANAIRLRITELQRALQEEPDEENAHRLTRRIRELEPLLREARALAARTAHYYDKGKNGYE